jgi:hypothetical protein
MLYVKAKKVLCMGLFGGFCSSIGLMFAHSRHRGLDEASGPAQGPAFAVNIDLKRS